MTVENSIYSLFIVVNSTLPHKKKREKKLIVSPPVESTYVYYIYAPKKIHCRYYYNVNTITRAVTVGVNIRTSDKYYTDGSGAFKFAFAPDKSFLEKRPGGKKRRKKKEKGVRTGERIMVVYNVDRTPGNWYIRVPRRISRWGRGGRQTANGRTGDFGNSRVPGDDFPEKPLTLPEKPPPLAEKKAHGKIIYIQRLYNNSRFVYVYKTRNTSGQRRKHPNNSNAVIVSNLFLISTGS